MAQNASWKPLQFAAGVRDNSLVPVASPRELVGRDSDLDRLERVGASLETGSAALVVAGEPGIGKTALWRVGLDRAEAAGVRVLRTRCAEVEMPISFGALADLLGEPATEARHELSRPQQTALDAVLGRSAGEELSDWLALAAAVLALLRVLSSKGPTVLGIDDLQWLDPGSRRVLAWALRRAGELRVGLVATLRDGGDADPLALADALPAGRFTTIRLPPLSSGALGHLVVTRLGVHLPRPTLARLRQASGGNPLFALEFARGLTGEGRAAAAGRLEVPESLDQLVRARVAALPRRLRPLLEIVSALDRATLPDLERALGPEGSAAEAVEEALRLDVFAVDDEGIVRFAHPLLASAVYFRMVAARRRALHARLAGIVVGAEERARHAALAAVEPDATTASEVEAAADAAAARGALDAAAALCGEAIRLTPTTDTAAGSRRVLAAAGWLAEIGEFASAGAQLRRLRTSDADSATKVEALLLRADCELNDRKRLLGLLREALAIADEPRGRWRVLIRLAHHGGWVSGDAAAAAELAREALSVAAGLGDPVPVDTSRAALEFYEAACGNPTGGTLRRRGRAPSRRAPRTQWWEIGPGVSLGCRLMWAGELDRAGRVLEDEVEAQRLACREAKAGFALCWLSELEWRRGAWAQAAAYAAEATERLGDVNPTAFPRALLAASTGRADEALEIAQRGLAWADRNDERVAPPRFQWALGLLELGRGDPQRAADSFGAALAALDAAGIREPGYLPVLADLVESLVALGRLDEAAAALTRLEASTTGRWAAPAAARGHALLLLGRGEAPAAAAAAVAAAEGFAALGAEIDRARADLVAGNAWRRAGERRAAAARLRAAAETFAHAGATPWLEQAELELRRASPRRGSEPGELTAAESRVATLVAAGRKNKEVAGELYTTVATVEAHLTRIYRKLGLRSRAELARLAATEPRRLAGGQE